MSDFVRVPADGAGKRVTTKVYADSAGDLYTQVVHVGDRSDPTRLQTIAADGSALVEFSSGVPQFNAFNRLLTTQDDLLSAFKFYEGPKAVATKIDAQTTGSASVFFNSANQSYTLRCPSGTGQKATLSSHRRFSYKPGASITMFFVVSGNATSQPNNIRRAGLFDENDGLFLELEDGVINVVIRKGGVDTKVPQSAWNNDRVDGAAGDFNRSSARLNPGTMNIFFITYQYLSAGAVTFGHYVGGTPTVLHRVSNYGELTSPYMENTYLPHRFECENTGIGQTGDTDLYTFCSATVAEGYTDLLRTPLAFEATKTLSTDSDVPIITFRPKQTYQGDDNRYRYLLQYVSAYTHNQPVVLTLWATTTPSGATYEDSALGLEIDTAATGVAGGLPYGKLMLAANQTGDINLTLTGGDNSTDGLFRNNDITQSDVWSITGRRLTDSGDAVVTVGGSFFQVE